MQKLTLLLKSGSNVVNLENYITTTSRSRIFIKNVYIYWYFKNVVSGVNNKLGVKDNHVYLDEEYWTFDTLALYFNPLGVTLRRTTDGKCEIRTTVDAISLGMLALLLGFEENKDVQVSDGWMKSEKHVNVNRGFKYITVNCTDVNSLHNFDVNGKRFLSKYNPCPLRTVVVLHSD